MALDLSVIIVNWNGGRFLKECLESILRETSRLDGEIIVVDNASTDGSRDMVKRNFPEVKVISNRENLGFSKGNNIGIKQSSGEFICLVNSDVEIVEGSVEPMLEYMRNHPEAGMMGPKVLSPDLKIAPSCRSFPNLWRHFCRTLALDRILAGSMKNDRMRRVDVLFGIFWLLRRGALELAGLLDEDFFMYGEDMDLCKRFREGGWEIIYFPGASIVHYGGGSSESDPMRFYLEKQKSDFLYWKKYHNRLSQALYLLMMFAQQGLRFLCWSLLSVVPLGERGRDPLGFKTSRSLMAMRFCLGLLCRRSG